MYLVYIIKSENNLYYVGMTNNFFRRWLQHNCILSGGARYTKKDVNWYPICIIDGFINKKEAMQCEWAIKSKKSKISRFYKKPEGRIKYLNILFKKDKWTNNSPYIKNQNLNIYIDDYYNKYLTDIIYKELYWK